MALVNEMSRENFGLSIADDIAEIRNKALQKGVTKESIEEIITSVYQMSQGLSKPTAVRKIISAISIQIKAASATTLIGVLVGSRDIVGKRSPIRYTLVKKDKGHVEISNFGTTAQYQGEDIEIPAPAMVTLKAEYDSEYDSWNLVSIESFRELDKATLQKVLSQVVIPVASITKDMAYSKGHAAKPVVINGGISYVAAEVVFKARTDEEREEGKKAEIDHALPMIMPRELAKDSKDALPCFQFGLKGKGHGGNRVRCHLSAQRYGKPNAMITDLESLCIRAVQKHGADPDEQAKNLLGWLQDMNVLVVGTVSTVKKTYGEDKSETNYVDIGVSCILEVEGTLESGAIQKQIEEAPKSAPHITTETPPISAKQPATKEPEPPAPQDDLATAEAELAEAQKRLAEAKAAKAAAKAEKAAKPAAKTSTPPKPAAPAPQEQAIENLVNMIKVFCRASGTKPSDLDIDTLKKKALDIVEVNGVMIPDAVILEAIKLV